MEFTNFTDIQIDRVLFQLYNDNPHYTHITLADAEQMVVDGRAELDALIAQAPKKPFYRRWF